LCAWIRRLRPERDQIGPPIHHVCNHAVAEPGARRPLADTATRSHAGGVAAVPSPGGVVSTCSTDQPLRHRRSSVSTRMPVRCDHPMRVSVSPLHVSTSTPLCGIAAGDWSSLGDLERGKSPNRENRRRSGSARRDRSVSRSSLRRNSSLRSGRWSRAGFRRGRRSSVTSEPPPPRHQVPVGAPRGWSAVSSTCPGCGPSRLDRPWPPSCRRRASRTGRQVSSCTTWQVLTVVPTAIPQQAVNQPRGHELGRPFWPRPRQPRARAAWPAGGCSGWSATGRTRRRGRRPEAQGARRPGRVLWSRLSRSAGSDRRARDAQRSRNPWGFA
jgi:hypothetical protein